MYREALDRLHDADILARSNDAQSDSGQIIRILAFEVLLKCALLLAGQSPKANHNYAKHWLGLPGAARKEILTLAADRMAGSTDFSDVPTLLNWYQYIFEKARYGYELFDGFSAEEKTEIEEIWVTDGSLNQEAFVQYYPLELQSLIFGLSEHIAGKL